MDIDKIAFSIAESNVRGINPVDVLLDKYNTSTDIPSDIKNLILRGLKAFERAQDLSQRIQQKTLELNPLYYDQIRARIEQQENTPSGKKAKYLRDARTRKNEEQSAKAYAAIKDSMAVLNTAMLLYDNWKVGHKQLGECTKEYLLRFAKRESKTAKAHDQNSSFYLALSDKLQPKQKVKEGIDIIEAHKLRQEIYGKETQKAA